MRKSITFREDPKMLIRISQDERIKVSFKDTTIIGTGGGIEPYRGTYEVTPTLFDQTLETENKRTLMNIIVKAIPSNYGRITWDGAKLTVS